LGLNKEILLENQSMGDILKGRIPNKLVPLKHKVDGRWVDLGLGTISPIRDDAGNVQLRIFTRLDEPQYKISPYKELFTDKEIERLETDGHLGSTKKMKDFTSGRECECYVSVHEATNRLTTLPVSIRWEWVLMLNAGTFALIVALLSLPTMLISFILPERSIRFE